MKFLLMVFGLISFFINEGGNIAAGYNRFVVTMQSNINQIVTNNNQSEDQIQNYNLPDTIKLSLSKVKLDRIEQAGDFEFLNELKSERLGNAGKSQINITLYSDKDNNIFGVFKHKSKNYMLTYLGYAHDINSIEIHKLQLKFKFNGGIIDLVSCIGSSTLGYTYVIFNEASNSWFSFHNWGKPQVIDVNQDGIKEVILQFGGMHLNAPELNILSFQKGSFMLADINDEVDRLDTNITKVSSSFLKEVDNKVIVEIYDERSNEAPVLYYLDYGSNNCSLKQIRLPYRFFEESVG